MVKVIKKYLQSYNVVFGIYIKKYILKLVVASSLMIISTMLIMVPPYLIRNIIDYIIPSGDIKKLILLTFGTILILIFQSLFLFIYNIIFFNLNSVIILDIRKRLLEKISYLDFSTFNKFDKKYLYSRIERDPTYIHSLFGEQLVVMIKELLFFIVSLIGLFFISAKLSIFVILIIPVFIIPIYYYIHKMKMLFKEFLEKKAIENAKLNESLQGLRFLKKVRKEITAILNYYKYSLATQRINFLYGKYHFSNICIGNIFVSIIPILIFAYGGYMVIGGKMTLGTLIGFNSLLLYLFSSIQNLLNTNITIQLAFAAMERVYEIFILKEETKVNLKITNINQYRFENVFFNYEEENIFNNMNLLINKGEKIGIIGKSGAGKSTLVKLIVGANKIQSGNIIVNNKIVSESEIIFYRKFISIVEQEPILFNMSILDNIKLLNPTSSEEEIIQVAKLSYIHDYILTLPNSYNTILSENQKELSIGQKQRICIARALLRKPQILILDEATSGLDSESEMKITETINSLPRNMIVIIITHKYSTLKDLDKIYVLEDGNLNICGNHSILKEKCDLYRQYFQNNY